jgi:hypothetical protein
VRGLLSAQITADGGESMFGEHQAQSSIPFAQGQRLPTVLGQGGEGTVPKRIGP